MQTYFIGLSWLFRFPVKFKTIIWLLTLHFLNIWLGLRRIHLHFVVCFSSLDCIAFMNSLRDGRNTLSFNSQWLLPSILQSSIQVSLYVRVIYQLIQSMTVLKLSFNAFTFVSFQVIGISIWTCHSWGSFRIHIYYEQIIFIFKTMIQIQSGSQTN